MAERQERKITPRRSTPRRRPSGTPPREGKLLIKQMHRLRRGALLSARDLPVLLQRSRPSGSEASGSGTIYTYSVMRRAPVPYAIAYVDAGRRARR